LARGPDVASVANQVEDQPALQIGARVGYAVSGVLHLLIGWIDLQVAWFASFSFAVGQAPSSKTQSADFTPTLLQHSGGRLSGGRHRLGRHRGRRLPRVQGMDPEVPPGLEQEPWHRGDRAGVVGYIAKGIALAVVGALFVTAAVSNSSTKATGLDGALRSMREQAVGSWLLTGVALGIASYGLYTFARARHVRV
jgi:Domain of Unknown Function (DUF1206)